MGNFLSDMFGGPEAIDPNKVGSYMQSAATDTMSQRANDMVDPNSAMMQAQARAMQGQASNDIYTQQRLQRQNQARMGGGQSGILNQALANTANTTSANAAENYATMVQNNMGQSNQLLGQVQQADLNKGQAMASAYGQNITNQNNHNAAMGNMALQMGSSALLMMCDGRMKKSVKKIGHTITNGSKVGVYSFKYKGRDKTHHGVIAQEVQRVNPKAVNKGKNGLLYVNYGKL
jgi:hypothetical protein